MIFNSSYDSGIVPESWKIGQITALFKKGKKNSAANYRPVSLTSIICKAMEKLVRKKIVDHMAEYSLFSRQQFGFIKGRSTTLQLLKVLDSWTEIIDQGGQLDVVYMDFMKAFDKVPHQRLLMKLKSYGLSDKTCAWVKDFLSNRKQRVHINGSYSRWHSVTSGIPQGSVLGPILFVVFINDLPECVTSDVYMFADDTKLYRQIKNKGDCDTIQGDLDNLFEWSEKWLLRFHPDKCIHLEVKGKQKTSTGHTYTMRRYEGGEVDLQTVNSEKDIGVTVDANLTFEEHIQNQVNKANRNLGIIRRSFKYLDMETFCLLYKALVRPHLEYAASVWNPYKKKDIDSIENVQRRATKLMPILANLSYEERLEKLKLPTLKFRRLRGDMIEVFKILSGIYDKEVTVGLFVPSTNTNTRGNSKKLQKSRNRLDIRKNYFTNRVIDVWNSLPEAVISAKTVKSFETRLDSHWSAHPLKYDYTTPYNCYTGTSKLANNIITEPNIEEEATFLRSEKT